MVGRGERRREGADVGENVIAVVCVRIFAC